MSVVSRNDLWPRGIRNGPLTPDAVSNLNFALRVFKDGHRHGAIFNGTNCLKAFVIDTSRICLSAHKTIA